MTYQHHPNEAKVFMKREHAQAIMRGGARMPREHEPCDMSCQFSFACQNYDENGTCRGFLLLSNGKLSQHIRKNVAEACNTCLQQTPCETCNRKTLEEPDRLGVQNYIRMIQQTSSPEILNHLVPVVYRFLKPPEKKKEQRCTMIGLQTYIITENEDGSLSLRTPEPKPTPKPLKNPIPRWKLEMLSKNQERIKRGEKEK